jgi:nanoRNase/pAp phosphatase (c-di-AMP/oligoRNAs hydrolase)
MENRAMVDLLKMPVRPFRAKDLRTYSHVALVDTQPAFANNSFPDTRRATIVIDQHSSDKKIPADLFIRDEACGATCVILARCLVLLKAKIPASLATALAYGILSDTLNFYRCKFPQVIETYLKILPFSDLGLLAHIQNPSRSRKFFTTLSKAIRSATAYGPVMVSHIGRVENPDLVSQVCDFLLTYEDAQWSLCTGRFRQTLHMSLRGHHPSSKASLILRNVVPEKSQAGGHATIAGGAFRVQRRGKKVLWSTAEQEIERNLLHELGQPRVKRPLYPFDGNGG